jgi:hypothetical protein
MIFNLEEANVDEMPVYVNMPSNNTLSDVGSKCVVMKEPGNRKM